VCICRLRAEIRCLPLVGGDFKHYRLNDNRGEQEPGSGITRMSKRILILNGPNLNLLGTREPGIYGSETLADVEVKCRSLGEELGVEVAAFQSNDEGELVAKLQEAGRDGVSVILNAGAYSHTSIAIPDAITASGANVIELHISNIYARETFRHHSHISAVARGVICGLGTDGYLLAIRTFAAQMKRDGIRVEDKNG
jgi:3-dehydroquinate dehydratase-2